MNIWGVIVKVRERNEILYRKGIPRRGLAKKAGIAELTAQQICKGTRNPSAPVAQKIMDALGSLFDDIFKIRFDPDTERKEVAQ